MDPAPAWSSSDIVSIDIGYTYSPLGPGDTFRLLKLLPSTDPSAPLECSLSERDIEASQGGYAALSYTWGDTGKTAEMTLDGVPVRVTENLYSALVHLRGLGGLFGSLLGLHGRTFWVDALCINQRDAAEKGQQVGQMRRIFAGAAHVAAWLGPAADGSGVVLEAMNGGDLEAALGRDPPLSPDMLAAFLRRDWWARVWVVQELMVARQLWFVCGADAAISYYAFSLLQRVINFLDARRDGYHSETPFRDLLNWRMYLFLLQQRFEKQGHLGLMYWVELTHDSAATDARDHIFALHGLLHESEGRHIELDYRLSPCVVFCSAVRVMAMDSDPDRAATIVKMVGEDAALKRRLGLPWHDPLEETHPDRQTCDGLACESRALCFRIPERAKPSGKRIMHYLVWRSSAAARGI